MNRIVLAVLFGFGALLFTATFWIQNGSGGSAADLGSRFAPQLFSGALMVFSALALMLKSPGEEHAPAPDAVTGFVVLVVVAYAVALTALGYLVSTFLALMLVLAAVRAGGWWRITLFSASITGALYFIFERVMLVGLPAGPWRI